MQVRAQQNKISGYFNVLKEKESHEIVLKLLDEIVHHQKNGLAIFLKVCICPFVTMGLNKMFDQNMTAFEIRLKH